MALFVVAPLWLLAITVAIRSSLFDFNKGALNAEDTKALWVFIASGLTAAVTLTGLLLTANHNRQAEKRLGLDTAVKGIALTHVADGSYAKKAVVAGALSTLVHLHHPVIAMRMLAAIWEEGAVDKASAIWLIDEALERGTPESKVEASRLFDKHAEELCHTIPGQYEFPAILEKKWPSELPYEARLALIFGIPKFLTSKPIPWWTDGHHWVCPLLEAAREEDKDKNIQAFAARMLKILLYDIDDSSNDGHRLGSKTRTLAEIKVANDEYVQPAREFNDPETRRILEGLDAWRPRKEQ
ncbi:hypothetical protein ACFWIY_02370 [Streptomyces sioyaensis]|uniref:hypothetical protein n=1 Tax=Streptomyces sioyaensis TaxID=67364 RepID=UPI00364952DE